MSSSDGDIDDRPFIDLCPHLAVAPAVPHQLGEHLRPGLKGKDKRKLLQYCGAALINDRQRGTLRLWNKGRK